MPCLSELLVGIQDRFCKVLPVVKSLRAKIIDKLSAPLSSRDDDNPSTNFSPEFQARAREKMEDQLLDMGKYGLQLTASITFIALICLVVTIPLLSSTRDDFPGFLKVFITLTAIYSGFVCSGRRIGKWELRIATTVLHAFIILRVLSLETPSVFIFTASIRHMLRLALCLHGLDWRSGLAWNLVHAAVALYHSIYSPNGLMRAYGEECVALLGMMEAIVCFVSVVLQRSLLFLLKTRIESKLQYDELNAEHKIAKSFLSATCDARVSLGPDLELMEDLERFSAMIMVMSASPTSMVGKPFMNYIAEEDKVRVAEFLRYDSSMVLSPAPVDTMPVRMFHADLRDVNGQQFPVSIVQVRFLTENGEAKQVLGIREEDTCRRQQPELPHTLANRNFERNYDKCDALDYSSIGALSSASGSSAGALLCGIENVIIECSCEHERLPIRSFMICFHEDVAAAPSFIDWFTPAARAVFETLKSNHVTPEINLPGPQGGALALSPPSLFPFGNVRMVACVAEFGKSMGQAVESSKELYQDPAQTLSTSSSQRVSVKFSQFKKMDRRQQMQERARCPATTFVNPLSRNAASSALDRTKGVDPPTARAVDSPYINLRVRHPSEPTMYVQIKRTTRLHKLMHSSCHHFGTPHEQTRFVYRGTTINADDCAEGLTMKDGDVIDMLQLLSNNKK